MNYQKTSHSVYDIKYHLVWITKYRKPVLRGGIGKRVREPIRQTCGKLDVYVVKGHVGKDHIHLLVSVPPTISVSELAKQLKGRSSRKMLQEYTELRREFWGRHLWARGYFAASTGTVTDEVVAEYIENQSRMRSEEADENFHVEEDLSSNFIRPSKLPTFSR